jgi:2Fe-2S ferredoxin
MEAGIMGGVPFEVACGGNAECCTCHVYLDLAVRQSPDYTDAGDKELDAIDFAEGATDESRLACQLKICQGMDGQIIKFVNAE